MLKATGRSIVEVVRGVRPRQRARQDSETAQIRAFLQAGHPGLAFSVVVVRRLSTCTALVSAFFLLR